MSGYPVVVLKIFSPRKISTSFLKTEKDFFFLHLLVACYKLCIGYNQSGIYKFITDMYPPAQGLSLVDSL